MKHLPSLVLLIVLTIVYFWVSTLQAKSLPKPQDTTTSCSYSPQLFKDFSVENYLEAYPPIKKNGGNPLPEGNTTGLTEEQIRLIELAYETGKPYDLSYALIGILMQETQAGKLGRIGDIDQPLGLKSYGVMQIKVATAEKVLEVFPSIKGPGTEEELIGKLIYDDSFSMKVALGYLRILQRKGISWRETLAAYNLGYSGMRNLKNPENFPYVRKVIKHIHKIQGTTLLSSND